MFRRRLSRLRTASFVIFVASVVYFIESLLRYTLFNNDASDPSSLTGIIHKNSRILLNRLTEDNFKRLAGSQRTSLAGRGRINATTARAHCRRTNADYFGNVVDSDGRICAMKNVDVKTSCCPVANWEKVDGNDKFRKRNSTSGGSSNYGHQDDQADCQCCLLYLNCVSNCILYPNKYSSMSRIDLESRSPVNDVFFKKLPVAFLKNSHFTSQIYTEFDLCTTVCRTNSGSITQGNVYKSVKKFCYFESA